MKEKLLEILDRNEKHIAEHKCNKEVREYIEDNMDILLEEQEIEVK